MAQASGLQILQDITNDEITGVAPRHAQSAALAFDAIRQKTMGTEANVMGGIDSQYIDIYRYLDGRFGREPSSFRRS